jgi:endonuclease YncB( thermonuclease family)
VSRNFRRYPSFFFVLCLCLVVYTSLRIIFSPQLPALLTAGNVTVHKVHDNGTLEVHSNVSSVTNATTVKMLGVSHIEPQAIIWLQQYLQNQKKVSVSFDKRRQSRAGETLAYVWLNKELVNAILIQKGWARYEAYPGDAYREAKLMQEAVKTARINAGKLANKTNPTGK